jgi:hypothetical protein
VKKLLDSLQQKNKQNKKLILLLSHISTRIRERETRERAREHVLAWWGCSREEEEEAVPIDNDFNKPKTKQKKKFNKKNKTRSQLEWQWVGHFSGVQKGGFFFLILMQSPEPIIARPCLSCSGISDSEGKGEEGGVSSEDGGLGAVIALGGATAAGVTAALRATQRCCSACFAVILFAGSVTSKLFKKSFAMHTLKKRRSQCETKEE